MSGYDVAVGRIIPGPSTSRAMSAQPGGRKVLLVGLALVAAACAEAVAPEQAQVDADEPEAAPIDATEATEFTVGVDGTTDEFTGMFLGFYPDQITVHPGDAIVFGAVENGEPHTVTIGTEVPTEDTVPGEHFFDGGFGGLPRADASMACYLAEGRPPSEGCPPEQQEPIAFDGTQSWVNSGGLLGEEEFRLELADDIAPGSYTFVCLVHASLMKGTIDVVAPDEPADDPAEVLARGSERLDSHIDRVRPFVEQTLMPTGQVAAGLSDHRIIAWANIFAPEEIEVPVGGSVTWVLEGGHTISFNMPESARPFLERAEDGRFRENELAAEPAGDPDAWDGDGALNSGLKGGPAPENRFTVTFTREGTYPYRCLVHFDMDGRVKVGG